MILQGKVALVTGGTTGIGRATAIALAAAGMKVVFSGRRDAAGEVTTKLIHETDAECLYLHSDVSNEEDVKALIHKTIETLRHYSTSTQNIAPKPNSLATVELRQAIDYIQAHLDQNLSLAEIAAAASISPTYFSRLFKRATGSSPHQYVIQQRVERAKVLLKTTDLAIASIALKVGFSSQSHLTQHFKRLTGVTPKQVSKITRI
ncbi:MAG: SDR family NAD(P)-dependent oxidoreductase [Nostoc sp. EfeVER01]|uniref:SDR family NAD(P)-dependent oxidoreductase n=1 Tax=Nostoc sp. EfeVER01 TaxID=3075406 RepID=UPI002AD38ED7|nr:SDR family NAD(P)-dependent oxidoreductase [Nostoc sp. EfeVER01]MDZ7946236.1 SDR family NAD(P)-dependent oxidoreductase [Nostoc sp. EfeVER01]